MAQFKMAITSENQGCLSLLLGVGRLVCYRHIFFLGLEVGFGPWLLCAGSDIEQ